MYSRQCYIRIAGIVYLTRLIVFAHLSLNQWDSLQIYEKKKHFLRKTFLKLDTLIRAYVHTPISVAHCLSAAIIYDIMWQMKVMEA